MRELTPQTSYGFAVIDFARDVLMEPLDPWEEWAVIHGGELLPDGRPRFRQLLILVARQNGKTHLCRVLALFWLFVEQWPLIVGMSTNLDYAKEPWEKAVEAAQSVPALAVLVPRNGVRRTNGEQALKTTDGCRYKIAASNRKGGRSLSIDRLITDELREHASWVAYNAAYPAMNARPFGQAIFITNQGDDTSVVLNSLRDSALEFIESGAGDPRLGLLEWSAPDGCDLLDEQAWAMANPNLGLRLDVDTVRGAAIRASRSGGEEEAGFRTEVLCQRVRNLDAAVDSAMWTLCHVPGSLDGLRSGVALCVDVSPDDGQHATLAAAALLPDGRVRVELVASWSGASALADVRADLPTWLKRIKPKTLGWLPGGPAAALAATLAERNGRTSWPPPGVTVSEIRTEAAAACMGFADLVKAREVVHSNEPLLTAHVTGAAKLHSGDVWRFSRKGDGHCDAAYAAAGAVHLARILPTPVGKPRLIISRA